MQVNKYKHLKIDITLPLPQMNLVCELIEEVWIPLSDPNSLQFAEVSHGQQQQQQIPVAHSNDGEAAFTHASASLIGSVDSLLL